VDNAPLGGDFDRREMNELLGLFDAPAFVRRARGVEEAFQLVLLRGRQRRDEWLAMPRLRLGQLHALAGGWPALRPLLADDGQVQVLERLWEALSPRLRAPLRQTTSVRALRRALAELVASLERFNRRWREYLGKVDVATINGLRDGYNRHYVLEKACALRSDVLARQGFTPLPPLTTDELERHLPPLPVPRPRG
jgi:hypothetical protein